MALFKALYQNVSRPGKNIENISQSRRSAEPHGHRAPLGSEVQYEDINCTELQQVCLCKRHKGVWGNGGVVSPMLNLSTRYVGKDKTYCQR